ncbi:MAG TPA: DUF1343 domain-containing protein [Longimicrobiales bacterium]|nr:DUF1343 domain-containing protein [Longimicrobiales bacterium]
MVSFRASRACVIALPLVCGGCAPAEPSGPAAPAVRPGASVLLTDSLHLVRHRRVGLITNQTGLLPGADPGAAPRSTIDALFSRSDVDLVALFGPEHGLRGDLGAGERVESGRDPATGLPVYSLYTEGRRPPPGTLDDLDVLVFDVQDVGARYYTYVYTMALAMVDAGVRGIPFVVLDRPDPIGGLRVQGNVLDTAFASFVGMYPVPMRHGMTAGELARLYVGEFGVEVELHVVPADGWTRDMSFEDTGLPWVPPSPNMPSPESALHYPGTCLFEGTSLSVGRGTSRAFQWIGAPWLDGPTLAERLNGRAVPGVRFEGVRFTPEDPGDGKFDGLEVEGVRFVATDPAVYDPTVAAVAALLETRRMSGERWTWRADHFDRLAGTDRLRRMVEEGRPLDEIVAPWAAQLDAFRALRAPYLLYPRETP